jgi:hypothetical protein
LLVLQDYDSKRTIRKKYNQFLEINHLSDNEKIISLKGVFDKDISNNPSFLFRNKIIRPLKRDGLIDVDILFSHLIYSTENEKDEMGKIIKKRKVFDSERSKRLHWIWHHIQEKTITNIDVFSYLDRINSKNVVRTYIYDFVEKYVIILEPQRSKTDYYLLTAYHLSEKLGGIKSIEKKRKNKLLEVL